MEVRGVTCQSFFCFIFPVVSPTDVFCYKKHESGNPGNVRPEKLPAVGDF
jgi:hypothetical protein